MTQSGESTGRIVAAGLALVCGYWVAAYSSRAQRSAARRGARRTRRTRGYAVGKPRVGTRAGPAKAVFGSGDRRACGLDRTADGKRSKAAHRIDHAGAGNTG